MEQIRDRNRKKGKKDLFAVAMAALAGIILAAIFLFWIRFPDNLMHSDMAAEVILARLLNDEGKLVTSSWYYSTEIRIIYSQLVMMPLFYFTGDFGTVKLLSILILDLSLAVVYFFTARGFGMKKSALFLSMALLLSPLSTEYLDMMYLGNFYTCQVICTYLFLLFFFALYRRAASGAKYVILIALLCLSAFIVGLSGVRYPANLFLPLLGAVVMAFVFDRKVLCEEDQENGIPGLLKAGGIASVLTAFSLLGCFLNARVLPKYFSFYDMGSVGFVKLRELPERLAGAFHMIPEFVGFRFTEVTPRFAAVNVLRIVFILVSVLVLIRLTAKRKELLNASERLLLYFFYMGMILNFGMEVFLTKDQEYRYYIPNYVILVLLYGIYLTKEAKTEKWVRPAVTAVFVLTAVSTLYSELWQDTKYNDCEKRYGYMKFLEEQGYDYGYATFWNGSVTEYLSNGRIHVGSIAGEPGATEPYRWLVPKAYFTPGFHEGKTFLLLAVTEEPAIKEGVISIMQDSVKVYEDEYYVIYEGEGMYLFN